MADVCDVYFCSVLALPLSYFTGKRKWNWLMTTWLHFDEGHSNGVDWYWYRRPPPLYFFIVDIIAVIAFCSHAASLCDVSSVYTILAATFSHKPLEPGVGPCALSALLCWVRHFVYRLAITPIAIQLNPILGITISQAQDCNAAICIPTLSCTVRVGDTWWAASLRTTC